MPETPPKRSPRDPATFVGSLETPAPHQLRPGAANRFSGFVLRLAGEPFSHLEVRSDGAPPVSFRADLPSPDLGGYLPGIEGSARCRFDFELTVAPSAEALEIAARPRSGPPARLLTYPVARVREEADRLRRRAERLREVPTPPPALVAATQGGENVEAYTRSVIPSVWTLESVLGAAGIDAGEVGDVLDFGCGTGRLLLSWWLRGEERRLEGCDLNGELIDWGRAHLPPPIRVRPGSLDPPLPYPSGSFDLVQAVSVFTHLSCERQERWVAELARLLRPGGVLLATLHGPLYVQLLGDREAVRAFEASGYLEGRDAPEGSNGFATFHSEQAAAELFAGLEALAHLPRGEIGGERPLAPLAMYQDVYVLRRPP